MTTYINLHGQQIEIRSADPTNPTLGQIWYNTTFSALKAYQFVSGWSTGGNLSAAKYGMGGAGTQTAGLGFGGSVPPVSAVTQEYDGSAWAAGGSMGTARYFMGSAGTQTAGLGFGGYKGPPSPVNTVATEEYDGSTWTAGGNMGTIRNSLTGCGIQTAGLAFGGFIPGATNATEEYMLTGAHKAISKWITLS